MWTQNPPSPMDTALSAIEIAALLGGIALAVVSAPFSPGSAASGLLSGGFGGGNATTTVGPDRERIAYAACMEPRGYAVDISTPVGAGSK